MRINKKELSFLSTIFPKDNPLGLLSGMDEVLEGNEQKTLAKKGIMKEEKLTSEANKLLNAVADPRRCTRLVLKDGSYFIEKYAYKNGDAFTLVENDQGEVILSSYEKLEEALFQLSQWVGISDLKTFDIDTTLSNEELIILLAMADIIRRRSLKAYLGEKSENVVSLEQISLQLDNPEPGSLTRILTGNYNYSIPKSEDRKEILKHMISKKIINDSKGYKLLGEYEAFASNFLIPETVVMLETFNLTDNNEIAGAGVLCICAGIKEIISIVFKEKASEFVSISGRQLVKMMQDFLNCPEVI